MIGEINYKSVIESIINNSQKFPVKKWSLIEENHVFFKYIRLEDVVKDETLYKIINSEKSFNEMYYDLLTTLFISGQANLKK